MEIFLCIHLTRQTIATLIQRDAWIKVSCTQRSPNEETLTGIKTQMSVSVFVLSLFLPVVIQQWRQGDFLSQLWQESLPQSQHLGEKRGHTLRNEKTSTRWKEATNAHFRVEDTVIVSFSVTVVRVLDPLEKRDSIQNRVRNLSFRVKLDPKSDLNPREIN